MEPSRSLSLAAALLWAFAHTTSACDPSPGWVPSELLDEALAASLVVQVRQLNVYTGEGEQYMDAEFEILDYYKGTGPEGASINVTGFRQRSLCGIPTSDSSDNSQGVLFVCPRDQNDRYAEVVTNAQFQLNDINIHTGYRTEVDIPDLADGELQTLIDQSGESPTQFGEFMIFECSDNGSLYRSRGGASVEAAPTLWQLVTIVMVALMFDACL